MDAQIAQIVPCTEAEGPGRRFALWFQGCPLRCPGCCNPEMLPFAGGRSVGVLQLVGQMLAAQSQFQIEGITLLGGEPFAHAEPAAQLACHAQDHGLSVMVFSGFVREELEARREPAIAKLLAATDLLVDGPYLRDQPDTTRRWIGSTNQRIHFLSERYQPNDPVWQQPNTLEIRWVGGELTVNGFPAPRAKMLWQRPGGRQNALPKSEM
jgi:anaerobic ribonucleoside-triphosphate reductase activating protein